MYPHATTYILQAEPTFMKAQKFPIYLGMHTYSILKVHSCLQPGTYNTAVYCNLRMHMVT